MEPGKEKFWKKRENFAFLSALLKNGCRKCSHDIAYGALEYISGVKIGRNRSTFAFVNFSFKKLFF